MTSRFPAASGLTGAAVVAVVAVVVITASMQGRTGGAGAVPTNPATPTSTGPASTPSSGPLVPSPSTTPETPFKGVRAFEDVAGGEELAPGTYSLSSIAPLEIRFTVPSGWERPPDAAWFLGPTGVDGREIGGLSFWTPAAFPASPCQSEDSLVEMARDASVNRVVDRLRTLWTDALETPTATSLGGFAGVEARLATTCDEATATFRILDVDGQTLIVLSHVWGETSPEGAAELQEMVESVEIEVVSG